MPRLRLLCQAAACVVLATGCTKTVTETKYVAVPRDPTTTSSSTTTTTGPAIPYNWTNVGQNRPVPTPPQARSVAAGEAWIGAAEARWTGILEDYQTFIDGQIKNNRGEAHGCQLAWSHFQAERALFSPVPAGVAISDPVRQTIELVLGRIESNARICLAGHIGDFNLGAMTKEEDELVQIAQALDAVGADR